LHCCATSRLPSEVTTVHRLSPVGISIVFCIGVALTAAAGIASGQWGPPYPPYYGPRYDTTGAARLAVTPRSAEVYIDGYFVGVVDDYDGQFQRLRVEEGDHELQLFLDGYRTFTQKVKFVRGVTMKVMHTMEPLGASEASDARPKPDPTKRTQAYAAGAGQRSGAPPRGGGPTFGSLLLRVRPADAMVLIDGEVWTPVPGEGHVAIELAEGPHRLEVRKDGFRSYATTVHVRRGETVRLNVSLTESGHSGHSPNQQESRRVL
jgi:hypothetical protein